MGHRHAGFRAQKQPVGTSPNPAAGPQARLNGPAILKTMFTRLTNSPGCVHLEDTSQKAGKRNRTPTEWEQHYLVTADLPGTAGHLGC